MFFNYEMSKLIIPHPTLQNIVFLCLFSFVALLTFRKKGTSFLDKEQSDQLKGVGILLVVLGHLWYHVSEYKPAPILGDYAVTLFLVFSGFGLTLSYSKKPFEMKGFVRRRLTRVMVPYWVITIFILVLDGQLLGRHYGFGSLVLTFLGYNVDRQLVYLDYTRWYITLLLLYYLAFAFVYRFGLNRNAFVWLAALGLVLIVLRITRVFRVGMVDQIIAFPLGCALAHYRDSIYLRVAKRPYGSIAVVMLSLVVVSFILLECNTSADIWHKAIASVMTRMNSFFFCAFLILLFHFLSPGKGISIFLTFCGSVSYEVYLIHGPLLIKYNPLLSLLSPGAIVLTFSAFVALILALSYAFSLSLAQLMRRARVFDGPVGSV